MGTRGSLLAKAQSHLIKKQLETFTRDQFHMKTIKTEGDLKTQAPLWQLEGKDFFTKELDQALLNHEVDFVVHSHKDLGHVRPPGITLAAITERPYSEDILLVRKETLEQLPHLSILRVGTSSPRRIAQMESHLSPLLPGPSTLKITNQVLRGNVNTRLQKLLDGQYDAIVLALAGLERLAQHPPSQRQLQELVKNLNFMILPSSLFPSAAAQGALGIEINSQRQDKGELAKKLQRLHHRETAEAIKREREHFQRYGGGCHLAVGIQVEKVAGNFVHFQGGKVDDKPISQSFLERACPSLEAPFFLGLPKNTDPHLFLSDQLILKTPLAVTPQYPRQCSFVTSRHCCEGFAQTHKEGVIFTSGLKTWKDLAQRGYWVNGSTGGLGHGKWAHYLKSQALALFSEGTPPLVTYSARHAQVQGTLMACYERQIQTVSSHYSKQLEEIRTFFWTSYPQFKLFQKHFPHMDWKSKHHCCGIGKTFQEFEKHHIKTTPFISLDQFIELAKKEGKRN